ncbi:MAG: cryptochrome/photolyase family protein [Nocardioidaceae bacterium]
MPTAVMWFRRDLRLADNPALRAAVDAGSDGVLPLFVLDPALWGPAGPSRRAYLSASLADLGPRVAGLTLRRGNPVREVAAAARGVGAETVHVAADFGPYGSRRDTAVEAALAEHGIRLERLGSPYAVAPGRVVKADGRPYQVYTPFARAWAGHGWRTPVPPPRGVAWLSTAQRGRPETQLPGADLPAGLRLPRAGESAACARWRAYLASGIDRYAEDRDRPDLDATSHLSVHLKWGEIHPRTLLADLADFPDLPEPGRANGALIYRSELAWREFYADVLWRHPESARDYLRPEYARLGYSEPGTALLAWTEGRTGYPIVDAGMRQLRSEGWMHNRVRMIVASFLVKDLHIEWQLGARHFMHWLRDGDLASNAHGWQWVAGSGTDPAPYFRVFNPVAQGRRFDPGGDYVRRYVPELAGILGSDVHEPWSLAGGPPPGYPKPIVDHAVERKVALERYESLRVGSAAHPSVREP